MRRLSREEWIEAAFDEMCTGGIDALRVEPLASRLGVTKGSFYWHFENRRALHLALLETWEHLGTSAIIDTVEAQSDDPVEQLRALVKVVFAPDDTADKIETAIRSWAQLEPLAAEAAARVDERRLDFVAALLRSAGVPAPLARRRSRLMYRTLIGEFLWRSSGGPASTTRELDEIVELLTYG